MYNSGKCNLSRLTKIFFFTKWWLRSNKFVLLWKFLPNYLLIGNNGIIFQSRWLPSYNFLIQEHCKLIVFAFVLTFFKLPSTNVLQSFLGLILGFVEYHKKTFWIFWISFNIEFGTVATRDKYTISEIPNVLKIRILPSKVTILVFHTLRAFCIFLTVLKKFRSL